MASPPAARSVSLSGLLSCRRGASADSACSARQIRTRKVSCLSDAVRYPDRRIRHRSSTHRPSVAFLSLFCRYSVATLTILRVPACEIITKITTAASGDDHDENTFGYEYLCGHGRCALPIERRICTGDRVHECTRQRVCGTRAGLSGCVAAAAGTSGDRVRLRGRLFVVRYSRTEPAWLD